jgi:elongation factor 1 alpha-like protein
MGHLQLLKGKVSKQQFHKNQKEAEKLGKASFNHAFVMDTEAEERERGITINVGMATFTSDFRTYTILDNPGHKDFIANMITGTSQADCAVLVIDSSQGGYEKGFGGGGQTKEHAILAHSLGIHHMIVGVNKLEMNEWSEERYIGIVD